ncbi:MAG: hypothetical protein QM754_13850 [Tepidisphaeraceae bacterium]
MTHSWSTVAAVLMMAESAIVASTETTAPAATSTLRPTFAFGAMIARG